MGNAQKRHPFYFYLKFNNIYSKYYQTIKTRFDKLEIKKNNLHVFLAELKGKSKDNIF